MQLYRWQATIFVLILLGSCSHSFANGSVQNLQLSLKNCIQGSDSNLAYQACAQQAEDSINQVLYRQYLPYFKNFDEVVGYYGENLLKSFEAFSDELCQVSNANMYSQSGFDVSHKICLFQLKSKLRTYLQKSYQCRQKKQSDRNAFLRAIDSCPNFKLSKNVAEPRRQIGHLVSHYRAYMNRYYSPRQAAEIIKDLDGRSLKALQEYGQFSVYYCAMSSFLLDDGSNQNDELCRRYLEAQFREFLHLVFDSGDFR